MRRPLLPAAILVLAVGLLAGSAEARIYRWVDAGGTPHFTDRPEEVPPPYRDQIHDDVEAELESVPFNILEGLDGPAPSPAKPEAESDGAWSPSLPTGFDQKRAERMLEGMKGPMMAIVAVVALVMAGLMFALISLALLLGCRVVGQESPGFRKAYGIVIVQFLAGLVAGPGVVVAVGTPETADLGALLRMQVLQLVVMLAVNAGVLRAMLCESTGRAVALAVVVNLVLLGFGLMLGLGVVTCAGGAALLG